MQMYTGSRLLDIIFLPPVPAAYILYLSKSNLSYFSKSRPIHTKQLSSQMVQKPSQSSPITVTCWDG